MKNKFHNLILSFVLFLGFISMYSDPLSAQAGNVGTWPPDVELVEKCVDSADLGTNYISYYEVQTHRAGFTTTYATYRSNGSTFTVPAGKITMGMCPQSVSIVKDSIREVEMLHMCDQNSGGSTTFYRVIQRTYWGPTGAGNFSVIANISTSGTAYTVTGTVYDEPCVGWELPASELSAEITGSTSYTSANNYESWAVTNVGTSIITMTLSGGSAVNLYPGETRSCSAIMDWNRKYLRVCPQITVNATGGTAHVYVRSKL